MCHCKIATSCSKAWVCYWKIHAGVRICNFSLPKVRRSAQCAILQTKQMAIWSPAPTLLQRKMRYICVGKRSCLFSSLHQFIGYSLDFTIFRKFTKPCPLASEKSAVFYFQYNICCNRNKRSLAPCNKNKRSLDPLS